MMNRKGKGKSDMGKGRSRLLVTAICVYTFTFCLLHFPFQQPTFAQQLQPSEIPTPLTSRVVSPRFMNFGVEAGLSQGNVYAMLQDRHGFMWFATQDGLNRWDGHEMKVFKHEPFDDTSLSSSIVVSLAEDERGALWITSQGGGLNRMDPVTETFDHFRHDSDRSTSLGNDMVNDVLVAKDGRIWVSHESGVDRMNPQTPGVFEHFIHDPDRETSLSNSRAYDLFEDSSGRIWVGTQHGLNRLDNEDEASFKRFLTDRDESGCSSPDQQPENSEIGWILERPQEPGILWITSDAGLVRLDTETDELVIHAPPSEGRCFPLLELRQDPLNPGVLWIASGDRGLSRFDIRTSTFVVYGGSANNRDGLLGGFAFSVYTDRSGIVWVGTFPAGLSRFDPSSVGLMHLRHVSEDPNTIAGEIVTGLFQSRDGIVWVATRGQDTGFMLTELDRAAGTARQYRHDPNDPTSMSNGRLWGVLAEDAVGGIWFGSEGGLDLLDRSTERFRRFVNDPSDDTSFRGGRVTSLYVDRSGTLWIGQQGSVSSTNPLRPDHFTHYEHDPDDPETVTNGLVGGISEDRAGSLWLAVRGGLNKLDPISGKITRYLHDPDNPYSLSTTSVTYAAERRREPGIIWATTYGGGLNRLDVADGTFRHFTEKDGLANNGTYGFLEDEQGRLWISTNRGLSRFDPETETFRNYGLEVGLQGLEFNSGGFYKGPFGEFFFGGTNGLNAFFPNELDENSTPPQVTIVDLKLFNESVKHSGAVELKSVLAETEEVVFRHDQRDITLDFVALHYANPGSNEYAYKLDGWNDDWVYIGGQRTASFTNLDPGEYTFRVKAANSDGVWNEEGASIRLVIEPPFWMTWWFRLGGFLAVAGALYGGFRFRTRHLAARAHELEGQVETRTAELKQSNDQLEQSATIVEAINKETSFRRLLTKILEEARVIPGVEKATAIVYMPLEDRFRVRASSGWDVEAMQDIRMTRSQARARYIEHAEEVADDIFVAKNVKGRAGANRMAEFGDVASFLVWRVRVEDDVVAYLVFDNLTDENAFAKRDAELLGRLREHVTSAFIKTRILEDLQNERANLQTALDDLRSTQDRLVQSEKMASLGQLTAGIAHQIKNPLNFVNNFSDVTAELSDELAAEVEKLKGEVPEERLAELESIIENLKLNTQKIGEHGRRADGIVQNMLEHSKAGEGQRALTDINDLLEEYLVLAHHSLRSQGGNFDVHIVREFDDTIGKVDIVPQEMGRVFMNLIGNAFDALREKGKGKWEKGKGPTVMVSTSRSDSQDFSGVEIRIADNGPGIPDQVRDKIFEPFFTTKPTGSGTGLGLSMSYDIVTKGHGGSLEVESVEGEGATFIVRLPA